MAATASSGIMVIITAFQPSAVLLPLQFIKPPEAKDAMVILAATKKSFIPCARPRSAGLWALVKSVVAPIKPKFHPRPSSTSAP